jgi:signal transduction histidine kinase
MSQITPVSQHLLALNKKSSDSSFQSMEMYHLSHDLRGPLNSILGFAELLLEGIEGPLNENQYADVSAIYQSAQNLLHLINTVVDLSKVEAGRLIFELTNLDMNTLLQNVAAADFGVFKSEQVALLVSTSAPIPSIRADRDRVMQIFDNLLRFIFKYKKKGTITLIAYHNDPEITVQVKVDEFELPELESPELFELVVKVDPTGRSKLGKGGLELPLARFLAERQQGRLWVERLETGGVTFYLTLPIASA